MRSPRRHRTLGAAALLTVGLLLGPPATAATGDPELPGDRWATVADLGLPAPNESEKQQSIVVYAAHPALVYDYEGAVSSIETVEEEGADKVISLSADILFHPDKWDLPDSAPQRIKILLSDVPEGVSLAVEGHTDSVVGAVDNEELSEKRAQAVAEAITGVRPDLDLDVAGYGATRPKKNESGGDEDAARKANRRVELRYEG